MDTQLRTLQRAASRGTFEDVFRYWKTSIAANELPVKSFKIEKEACWVLQNPSVVELSNLGTGTDCFFDSDFRYCIYLTESSFADEETIYYLREYYNRSFIGTFKSIREDHFAPTGARETALFYVKVLIKSFIEAYESNTVAELIRKHANEAEEAKK